MTIPHKLAVIPLLDSISPSAKAIGAVNTIIPQPRADGSIELYGDNTDWAAIRDCAASNLAQPITAETTGLVIGAGGTSRAALYALHNLGISKIYLFNRTRSSAQELVEAFPKDYNIELLDSLDKFTGVSPSVIVSTIPATSTQIALTAAIFSAPKGGVVIDMAYKPAETPLLTLAKSITNAKWKTIPGVAVLLEQGYRQFEGWTDRRAPRQVIQDQVLEKYLAQ